MKTINLQKKYYKEWKQRNHFTLEHLSNLLENLIEQTLSLQKFNCISIGININDLYVVDNTHFFIFPSNNLYHINDSYTQFMHVLLLLFHEYKKAVRYLQ